MLPASGSCVSVALAGDLPRDSGFENVIDGLPFGEVRFGNFGDISDWTGPALEVGTNTRLAISGLRISDVSRLDELQKGAFSPPPDEHTLYYDTGRP